MSSSLDMSLDDIIRKNQRSGGHKGNSRRKLSSSGPGPERRVPSRDVIKMTPYPAPQKTMKQMQAMAEAMTRQHKMMPGGGINRETGTKLYISNLDYGVSNDDILLLFSDVGELIKHSIHYDRSGRSKGTAEVVFCCHADALAAVKRYNNIHLDGKPIKIELVGVNMVAPDPMLPTKNIVLENPNVSFKSGQSKVGAKERGNGGGRGSGARRHGRGDHHDKMPTKEDLDAELDKYHLEAMRIK